MHATFETYVKLNKRIPPEILMSVQTIDDPGAARRHDRRAPVSSSSNDKQALLETDSPSKRLERLYELMQGEIEILQVEKKIRTRVKKQMEKTQKEYYLNEQMQAIQKELGERDEFKNEMHGDRGEAQDEADAQRGARQGQEGAQEAQDDGADERRGDRRAQLHRLDPRAALGREDRGQATTSTRPSGSSTRTTTASRRSRSASSSTSPCRRW